MVKPVKLAIGVAVGFGLLALYMADDPAEKAEAEAPGAALVEAERMLGIASEPAPEAIAARPKKPRMSERAKQARAKRGEEIEARSARAHDDVLAPTDSITRKRINEDR